MIYKWCIQPKAFSNNIVDNIVEVIESNYELTAGLIQGSIESPNIEDKGYRVNKIAWVGRGEKDSFIGHLIWQQFVEVNRLNFGFDIQCIPEIQYTVYESDNNGHYDWHYDCEFNKLSPYDRKLTFILQLSDSDEYEGGNLLIDKVYDTPPDRDELREKGTMLVFPSFVRHKVTPVTKGVRRSLVAWAHGPKFR